MSTDELIEVVRRYALEHCPRTGAVRLDLSPEEGEGPRRPFLSALVPLTGPARPAAGELPRVGPVERRILRAVAALEEEEPTGPEIAASAKIPHDPETRKTLSAMRKAGLLGGASKDQGYPITPLGLAVLHAQDG